jgi:hypothetical protein
MTRIISRAAVWAALASCVWPAAASAQVDIEIVALAAPSGTDEVTALPASLTTVDVANTFVLEVWAQTTDPSGFSSVGLDLSFDPSVVNGTALTHSALFSLFTNGTIDNVGGVIDDLSGSHPPVSPPCSDAVGLAPNWARVAVIDMVALAEGPAAIQIGDNNSLIFPTAICGAGAVTANFGTLSLEVLPRTDEIVIVALAAPSATDEVTTLPTSLSTVDVADAFVLEMWVQTGDPNGFSSVGLDLSFDASVVNGTAITHAALFPLFTNGTIDNGGGGIDDLSGSHPPVSPPCSDAVGLAPNWARFAVIDMVAISDGPAAIEIGDSNSPIFPVAICGVGTVTANFGTLSLEVLPRADEIVLVPVATPGAGDESASLPAALTTAAVGSTFFVELWAQTADLNGFSQVTADLSFDPALLSATGITHTALYPLFTNGTIDNGAGTIDNLSGSHPAVSPPCSDQVGFVPTWSRVAIVEMTALDVGTSALGNGPSDDLIFVVAHCGTFGAPDVNYTGASIDIEIIPNIELVALTAPTVGDIAPSLPATETVLPGNETFYLEIWAQTFDPNGFAQVSTDVSFDNSLVEGVDIVISPEFSLFTDGTIDNGSGLLDNVSGSHPPAVPPCSDAVGVATNWARLATIEMTTIDDGTAVFQSATTGDVFLVVSHCLTGEAATVAYGGLSVEIVCDADDTVCNGVDDDCNGLIDDGFVPEMTSCGVGACADTGMTSCIDGVFEDSCTPGTPTTEICDGVDNDCNGIEDDPVDADMDCDDGAFCNGAETCQAGACVDGMMPCFDLFNCDEDNNECRVCTGIGDCADLDMNGIRDDGCLWWSCTAGVCQSLEVVFADMGGQFLACPVDGTADGNDQFHALNCFSDNNPDLPPPNTYPCEDNAPQAFNVDAGGQFGSCNPDGVCDGNDAFAALNAFAGETTCACPLDPAPLAPMGGGVEIVGRTGITLAAEQAVIQPGEEVNIAVMLNDPLADLRGYQLHLEVVGGRAGGLRLVDIAVEPLKNRAFDQEWSAFNVTTGQMVAGLSTDGVATSARAYLATFTFVASKNASGRFMIDVMHDQPDDSGRTFLFATPHNGKIAIDKVRPALVSVGLRR